MTELVGTFQFKGTQENILILIGMQPILILLFLIAIREKHRGFYQI